MAAQRDVLASARTFLFVPADRPERYLRAAAAGPGAVVIDLEDAIAPGYKLAAREALEARFAELPIEVRLRTVVRVNAPTSDAWRADLEACRRLADLGLGGIMCPKAECLPDLACAAAHLSPTGVLIPLVESLQGWDGLEDIARAPQVVRLAFGHLDFQLDLGLTCGPDEAELTAVRMGLVMASRRARLAPPIDGVTVDIRDQARLQSDAARARRGGFGAKLCIHPTQVEAVQQAWCPTAQELEYARRVVAAAQASAGGVVSLDGRMVDAPVIQQAERLLDQVQR
jgi:citrate lyase subunit beta / citryl-CoA lyase